MEKKIKSVEKGFGEKSIFYTTNPKVMDYYKVDEIKQESKIICGDPAFEVYRGYINSKLVFEMGINADVTVTFF